MSHSDMHKPLLVHAMPQMEDYKVIVPACVVVMIGILAVRWYNDPLRAIPTIGGPSLPALSYLGAFRMLSDCRDLLEEGYRKARAFPNSAFKVALYHGWMVVVSGRERIEELIKRGHNELSSRKASLEVLQLKYTLEHLVFEDRYHVGVLKGKLTRMLPAVLPDIVDEAAVAIEDNIIADKNEWTSVEILPAVQTIVARVSNRIFVGLPLCRNDKFLALAVDFSVGLVKSGIILSFFPRILKPLVAQLINPIYVKGDTHRAMAYLQPIIEERQKTGTMVDLGEAWRDKPTDLLQFLLEKAQTKNETTAVLTQRFLVLNLAAIHTSSTTIVHALYQLASLPDAEAITPLREEIEACVAADGWTATALGKMWKLDSFLRETLRYHNCLSLLSMHRMAVKDVVLADGTCVPQGTLVAVLSHAIHRDTALLAGPGPRADVFDPFRFARIRAADSDSNSASQLQGASAKHQVQFTSTSLEYLPFGHGPHACPGRFVAEKTLKVVLAHLILRYDMKLGEDGMRPPQDVYVAMSGFPAPGGCILFKRRRFESESQKEAEARG